jgi:hypothetical protein
LGYYVEWDETYPLTEEQIEERASTHAAAIPVPARDAVISGEKRVTGQGAPGTAFTFSLAETGGTELTDTATRTGAGTFSFSLENLSRGVHTFVIAETGTAPENWKFDDAQFTVTVTVTADGEAPTVAYPDGDIVFTNAYAASVTNLTTPSAAPSASPETSPAETPTGTPTETPTETPSGTPTRTPTPPVTPTPNIPGATLVPTEDGGYEEFDEDGTPLGEWRYDPDTGEWIFDPYVPLGAIPGTGDSGAAVWMLVAVVAVCGAAFALTRKQLKTKN